jgi:hypothetical protein
MAKGCGSSTKATINALDVLYTENSHMFLLLDELSAMIPGSLRTPEAIPDFINAHALGDQKARFNDGGNRPNWATIVLVTSNERLSRLCPQLDDDRRDALLDRYIEIPGIGEEGEFIEALHGHPTVESFAVAMKNSALAVAGIAAETLVMHLVNHLAKNRAGVLKTLRRKIAEFRREAQHIRVNARRKTRFALLYAAGTVARIAKVMPLEDDEIKQALLTCLEDHVRHVTGSAPLAPLDTLDVARALVRFREQAKASIPIANGRDKVGPVPFGLDYNGRSRQEWLLPSKALEAALTGITTSVKARALLAAAGLIVVEREGPERRYVVKRKVGINEDGSAQAMQVTAIMLEKLVAFASSRKV